MLRCSGDNFFSSLDLLKYLANKQFSYVGTIRLNRRELPDIPCVMKNEPRYASRFFKDSTGTASLVAYKAKPNKIVALVSSFHDIPYVVSPESEKKKPNVVESYNRSKCGVDCFDSMARMYSTRCACRRWPMYVLFNILDIAAINSWVLYKETTLEPISRRDFILKLVEELVAGGKQKTPAPTREGNQRRKCQTSKCQNKTMSCCSHCQQYVCGVHAVKETVYACQDCHNA